MSSPTDGSDTVTHTVASAESGQRRPTDTVDAKTAAAECVSPPLPLISEHQVLLGTIAATTAPPLFEGRHGDPDTTGHDADADAESVAVPTKRGWSARMLRRDRPVRDERSTRRHYPTGYEFVADARMDREMYRL